jgi:hypothetical protein
MDLWLLRPMFFERGSDMPHEAAPADPIAEAFRAADDQATAEAASDGKALVRFHTELVTGGLDPDLIADCCRTWLESYLDGSPCGPDCD